MATPNIEAMATAANSQGQQMLNSDLAKSGEYKTLYNTYSGQANTAQKNIADYTKYMEGEGSAGNQYHNELGSQLLQLGYDPAQMTAAREALNRATGSLSAYSDFANTGASKFGLNAGGFAAANAGALGSINNNIAASQQVVSGLSDLYKTAQTGANQFAGNVVQGEQTTLGGLKDVFDAAANQRDSASSMMNFYDQLAQQQGGLNAQQQQYYAAARQAYASATAAMAQASLYGAQADLARQQLAHQADLYRTASQPAATKPATPAAVNNNQASLFQHVQNGLADAALGTGHFVGHVATGAGHLLGSIF